MADHSPSMTPGPGRRARGQGRADLAAAALEGHPEAERIILVEGASDRVAIESLARRLGRDLAAERIAVVAMGGASSIGHFLDELGPRGRGLRVTGLCDAAEVGDFLHAIRRSGVHPAPTDADLASLGFFVCVEDLEDELVRALGIPTVEQVLHTGGDLRSWRTFQRQPAQRGRPDAIRVRRFLGAGSGRKLTYARHLVEALEPSDVPAPLDAVLAAV